MIVPSPRLNSLSNGRRAALEIRLAAAIAFRSYALPAATESALKVFHERVVARLLGEADIIRTISVTTPPHEVVERIKDACDLVRKADLHGSGESQKAIETRISEYLALIEPAISSGIDARLPNEIDRLFKSLDGFVATLYQRWCPLSVVRPQIYLDFGSVDSEESADALSGSCRLKDINLVELNSKKIEEAPPASWPLKDVDHRHLSSGYSGALTTWGILDDGGLIAITRLTFKDDAFDWPSLCQVPYVLCHELLCHAYQATATSRPEPRVVADKACAWTEGWMDVLAMRAVEKWLDERANEHPKWIATALGSLRSQFVERHQGRVRPQANLTGLERFQRIEAREKFDDLDAELRKFDGNENGASGVGSRTYAFSLALNALGLSQTKRQALLDSLCLALDAAVGDKRDVLIRAIVEFAQKPELSTFERALTSL
jgi:hypothetical protein